MRAVQKYPVLALSVALVLLSSSISACGSQGDSRAPADPVEQGRRIFDDRCSFCHVTGTEQKIGPGLAGLFAPGGPELPAGVDYGGRLPNGAAISEANVAEWIREGGEGQIGQMPGIRLSEQDMDALIAYLKTLEK